LPFAQKNQMITRTDVRTKWRHEEKDFTPWLARNLDKLSRVLGLDLELDGTEVDIGPYRADIVARLSQKGAPAVIENQLSHADPKHLGQLISYVARLKAKVGVWEATDFWHTNLCAIGSLNNRVEDSPQFFAVRLSLVESGNRTEQPVLDVRVHPKKWRDPVAKEFWSFCAKLCPSEQKPSFNPGSNLRRGRFLVKEVDLQVVQHFEADFVRVYVTGGPAECRKDAIARISLYRPKIVAALGKSGLLDPEDPHCKSTLCVNTQDQSNWSYMEEWFRQHRELYSVILRSGPSER